MVESLMEEIQGAEQATKASPPTAGPDSETEPDYASAPEVTRSTLPTLSVASQTLSTRTPAVATIEARASSCFGSCQPAQHLRPTRSLLRLQVAVQSEESSGDEGDNLWDPQHATPWRPRVRRRSGGHRARPSSSQAQLQVHAPCTHAIDCLPATRLPTSSDAEMFTQTQRLQFTLGGLVAIRHTTICCI